MTRQRARVDGKCRCAAPGGRLRPRPPSRIRLVAADADKLAVGVVVDNDVDGSAGVDAADTRVAAAAGRDDTVDMCGK